MLPYFNRMPKSGVKFDALVEIMARLRAPGGCPWDREQSYKDIAAHTLEETHEVLDAIDREDFDGLCEELGDLLLQVLFYAQIATEEGRFTIDEIIDAISQKLIHRHPHVFGETKVSGSGEVLKRWEELKKDEGKEFLLEGVPKALPALLKAYRIGEKCSRVGFDWQDSEGILAKVEEEAHELRGARAAGDESMVDHEYGDLLFTLANLGRFLGIDPEGSLRRASERFMLRFRSIEESAKRENRKLQSLSSEEWDRMWEAAKKKEVSSQ